jgi:hypothetical protein
MNSGEGMSETKKAWSVAFRLTDEECAQVERAAQAAGEDLSGRRRKIALTESARGVFSRAYSRRMAKT